MNGRSADQSGVLAIWVNPIMLLTAGATVTRAIRLLVMYDPVARRRWGPLLRERAVMRAVLSLTALLQILAWSFVAKYGISR